MDADTETIRDRLIETAERGRTTYYSDIAPLARLNMKEEADRHELIRMLGEIDRSEFDSGRPLLCAVVIQKRRPNIPRKGFFRFAQRLGLHTGKDDVSFWKQELRRVHSHWARQD